MTPFTRKLLFAVTFETLGVALATGTLLVISDAAPAASLFLSALNATIALTWNFAFNLIFEYWEARQPLKGRPLRLRALHALGFEGGLTLVMVPLMAWWLNVTLLQALWYEAAMIVLFIAFTYVFTYAFDRLFGLPDSAL